MEKITKEEVLKYMAQLDLLSKIKPNLDLSMYYLVISYNLLDIDELDLADAVFDRLTQDFRTSKIRVIAEDLAHLLQRKIEIENSMESVIDPGQKASLMVEYNKARTDSEMLIVILDFGKVARKSPYIIDSPEYAEIVKALDGLTVEVDLSKGKPTIN